MKKILMMSESAFPTDTRVRNEAEALIQAGYKVSIIAIRKYEHEKSTHYVNLPRNAKTYKASRDCADGFCVVSGIERYRDILADSSKSLKKRREALKFVSHFVGDIHQPMHVSFKSDWGANKVKLDVETDDCTNLHWLWDSCLYWPPASWLTLQA